jgi:hypothetical protein
MLQKNKMSNIISFLEEMHLQTPKLKEKPAKEGDVSTPQAASKLSSFDPMESRNPLNSVARASSISEPSTSSGKFMGMSGGNSIWDPTNQSQIPPDIDKKSETLATKNRIQDLRNEVKQKRLDDMVNTLNEVDQRKDATVIGVHSPDVSTYKMPSQGISIFDDSKEYTRVPEKTDGEKMVEAKNAEVKDTPDGSPQPVVSTKKIVNNLFDKLTGEKHE